MAGPVFTPSAQPSAPVYTLDDILAAIRAANPPQTQQVQMLPGGPGWDPTSPGYLAGGSAYTQGVQNAWDTLARLAQENPKLGYVPPAGSWQYSGSMFDPTSAANQRLVAGGASITAPVTWQPDISGQLKTATDQYNTANQLATEAYQDITLGGGVGGAALPDTLYTAAHPTLSTLASGGQISPWDPLPGVSYGTPNQNWASWGGLGGLGGYTPNYGGATDQTKPSGAAPTTWGGPWQAKNPWSPA